MAEAQFSQEERELLLTDTAAVRRAGDEDHPAGVVLLKARRTLCVCAEEDAKLIVKLFNHSPVPRPHL